MFPPTAPNLPWHCWHESGQDGERINKLVCLEPFRMPRNSAGLISSHQLVTSLPWPPRTRHSVLRSQAFGCWSGGQECMVANRCYLLWFAVAQLFAKHQSYQDTNAPLDGGTAG